MAALLLHDRLEGIDEFGREKSRPLGQVKKAEHSYRRAWFLKEKLLGPDNPDVALTIHNLAVLLADQRHRAPSQLGLHRRFELAEIPLPCHAKRIA